MGISVGVTSPNEKLMNPGCLVVGVVQIILFLMGSLPSVIPMFPGMRWGPAALTGAGVALPPHTVITRCVSTSETISSTRISAATAHALTHIWDTQVPIPVRHWLCL